MEWVGISGAITGGVVAIGTGVAILRRYNILKIGNARNMGCPDPDCHGTVIRTYEDLQDVKVSVARIEEYTKGILKGLEINGKH